MAEAHGTSARRELPLWPTLTSRRTRGGYIFNTGLEIPPNLCNSTNWEHKERLRGSIPLSTVWTPQPHWLAADWLMLMEQVRTKSFPLRQRRGPAAPVEDMFSSPDQKFFHIPTTNYSNLGMKTGNHGSFPPRTVWKSQSHGLVADWLGFMEPAHGESCPSGQRRRPAAPGEHDSSRSTIRDADPRCIYIQRFPKKMFRFGVPFPSFGVLV